MGGTSASRAAIVARLPGRASCNVHVMRLRCFPRPLQAAVWVSVAADGARSAPNHRDRSARSTRNEQGLPSAVLLAVRLTAIGGVRRSRTALEVLACRTLRRLSAP